MINRNEIPSQEKTARGFKWISQSKRSQSEKANMVCNSNCMTLWKKKNCGDNKKISGCQRFPGRKEWVEQGISGEMKLFRKILYNFGCYMSLDMLSKPTECTARKPEPWCKLWALLTGNQCWFVSCSKCTTVRQDVHSRENWGGGDEGGYGNYFLIRHLLHKPSTG